MHNISYFCTSKLLILKESVFLNITSMKYLNSKMGLNIFYIVLLFQLHSLNSQLGAQQTYSPQGSPRATIVLKNGAEIYSTDNIFNQQILTDKVFLKNSNVYCNEAINQKDSLKVIIKEKKIEEKDFNGIVKKVEEKKKKEILKNVKNEIDRYERKSKSFKNLNLNGSHSSNEYFSLNNFTIHYVTPSQNANYFSSLHILVDTYLISQALDFLYSQKYTYYNNKSLDFCFSEVFSVRPPPVLVFV